MSETKTAPLMSQKQVSIRINPDPSFSRMGLEKYSDVVIADGTYQSEQLSCVENNGLERYITGLDEFAPEVQNIENKEEKAAKIKSIREKVSWLEQMLNHNKVSPDDADFWNKIVKIHPRNADFWKKLEIVVGNTLTILDPKVPSDFILISCIEAGGFPIIAKSYDDAKSSSTHKKFYLDKGTEKILAATEIKKIRNRALSILQTLYDENSRKMLYIAKTLGGNSTLYKASTPPDVLYEDLDQYIHGKGIEVSEKKAANNFIAAEALGMENLRAKAVIMDAMFHKIISSKSDGMYYHTKSNSQMGHNVEECIEFLKSPIHTKVSEAINAEVDSIWNR